MKILFLLASVMLFSGCTKPPSEWVGTTVPISIKGLEGCTVTRIERGGGSVDRVYRCPNSQTTTRYNCGRGCEANISTIEDPIAVEPISESQLDGEETVDCEEGLE